MARARVLVPACAALALSVLARPVQAEEAAIGRAAMRRAVESYYDQEIDAGFVFVAWGAATAASGALLLTRDGDFERGLGWSSLIGGGLTALGGGGYALTVLPRRAHFRSLYDADPVRFKREEAEHIAGTDTRFTLYLGFEAVVALTGIGIAGYGFAADKELYQGIGIGTAMQGLGLLVIDVSGALRAARYRDQVRRFDPKLAFSIGGGGRPWAATLGHRF